MLMICHRFPSTRTCCFRPTVFHRRFAKQRVLYLIQLGLMPAEDGTSAAFFECSSSSLRYRLDIPKATRTERKKVKDVLEGGDDPDCPRHGPGHRLGRAGKDVVCNLCGVAFGRA